jgi:hypothetical protein
MTAAQHLLDQVQGVARIAALAAAPTEYAALLAEALAPATTLADLAQRDDQLRHALGQLDAMIERAMRIALDRNLADDTSIQTPTRKVFAATVIGYAGRLAVLEDRARDAAARGGARDPAEVAARVVAAAEATLALRDAVGSPVLSLARDLAAAALPDADRRARDRQLDDDWRQKWSAMRRELAAIVEDPARVLAPIATRLAAWPAQRDEPAPAPEATFADMIELD